MLPIGHWFLATSLSVSTLERSSDYTSNQTVTFEPVLFGLIFTKVFTFIELQSGRVSIGSLLDKHRYLPGMGNDMSGAFGPFRNLLTVCITKSRFMIFAAEWWQRNVGRRMASLRTQIDCRLTTIHKILFIPRCLHISSDLAFVICP